MVRIVSSLPGQAPPPVPPLPQNPTPLILHVDINETIVIGDEAGGDTREESLNKILAKSAFVRIPEHVDIASLDDTSSLIPTHWWDGTEIDGNSKGTETPPLYTGWQWPEGCMPYYRTAFKKRSKDFVSGHGRPFRSLYDEMERTLSFEGPNLPNVLSHMLPAMFRTLQVLSERDEPFRLVLRSFGSDIKEVAEAISLFVQGKHPDYPNFRNDNLVATPADLVKGRWNVSKNGDMSFQLWHDGSIVASGDEQVLDWIQERTICGIQDDYNFWNLNNCEPWAGKPVWVPARTKNQYHLLFDDNIHNLAHDSIASVRLQSSNGESFRTLSGAEIQQMQGLHLIRVPTLEPILNPEWFLLQIEKARARYADESQKKQIQ